MLAQQLYSLFSARLQGFFVCVCENAKCCVYTHVCLSNGLLSTNSATTKAAFQGYLHKAALLLICCNVSLPVFLSRAHMLSLTSLPHIPLNFLCLQPSVRFHIKTSSLGYLIDLKIFMNSLCLKENSSPNSLLLTLLYSQPCGV